MSEARTGTVILRDVLDARINKDDQKFIQLLSSVTLKECIDMVEVLQLLLDFSSSRIETLQHHEEMMNDIERITNKIKENIANSKE